MEVALADDDLGLVLRDALDLVAPLPGRLDGRLDRLGAGVHGQDLVFAGDLAQQLGKKWPSLSLLKSPRGQGDAVGLLLEGLDDPGMTMPVIEGRVGAEHVHVSLPSTSQTQTPSALAITT